MSGRRHWFHCTSNDHGPRWLAGRHRPRNADGREPGTPRLCVCPSAAECFAARLFLERPVFVYRTARPRNGVAPKSVWDQAITREKWLVPPVEMLRVGLIPASVVAEANAAILLYHRETKQKTTWMIRVAQLLDCSRVLLAHDPALVDARRLRFVSRLAKKWGIGDANDYILGRAEAGVSSH